MQFILILLFCAAYKFHLRICVIAVGRVVRQRRQSSVEIKNRRPPPPSPACLPQLSAIDVADENVFPRLGRTTRKTDGRVGESDIRRMLSGRRLSGSRRYVTGHLPPPDICPMVMVRGQGLSLRKGYVITPRSVDRAYGSALI